MLPLLWLEGHPMDQHGIIHKGIDGYYHPKNEDEVIALVKYAAKNKLFEKGWGINDLGGITHQTVGGFTATGSAGGSLHLDLDNVTAFRVVDGTGTANWIEQSDPIFGAMRVSVGLLGIVTKVRLQLNPTFNIYGQELTTPTTAADCPIDLFGPATRRGRRCGSSSRTRPIAGCCGGPRKRRSAS